MSSTLESSTYSYSASKAVDGVYLPSDNAGMDAYASLAHSNHETNPHWRVDLEGVHCIWAVRILNRAEGKHLFIGIFVYLFINSLIY